MLECAIHPITYRGEGILATVDKSLDFFVIFHKDGHAIFYAGDCRL